jgi:hypothetical protein
MSLEIAFRLPGAMRAVVESDFSLRNPRVRIEGDFDRDRLKVMVIDDEPYLFLDGAELPREDRLRAPTSPSAWRHAFLALAGSVFGFVASWLYLARADPWSTKMALHMAAWHLLLTLTLFPASVWGQRIGIRAVQIAAFVFFAIHLGIAIANIAAPVDGIAIMNAASGVAFLATTIYGQRAHHDMDPLRTLSM